MWRNVKRAVSTVVKTSLNAAKDAALTAGKEALKQEAASLLEGK